MMDISATNRPFSVAEALIDEGVMRHKSEIASALATLQITKAKFGGSHPLLDAAIARLQDQLELADFLSSARAGGLSHSCANVLRLLASSRAERVKLRLHVARVRAEPELNIVRAIMLLAYHLTVDALTRHRDRNARIQVVLASSPRKVALSVGAVIGPEDMPLLPGDPIYETVIALVVAHRGNVLVRKKGSAHEVRVSLPLQGRFRTTDAM